MGRWHFMPPHPPTPIPHQQFPPLPPDNKGAWALLSKSLPSALHSLFLLSQQRSPLLKLDFPPTPTVGMQGNGRQMYCIYHLYPNKDKDKTERKISGTSQQRFPTTTSRLATNWCNNQIGDIRPQTQDWRRKSAKTEGLRFPAASDSEVNSPTIATGFQLYCSH